MGSPLDYRKEPYLADNVITLNLHTRKVWSLKKTRHRIIEMLADEKDINGNVSNTIIDIFLSDGFDIENIDDVVELLQDDNEVELAPYIEEIGALLRGDRSGMLYGLINPADPNCIRVGAMAGDGGTVIDAANEFDPRGRFTFAFAIPVSDRYLAERIAHESLKKHRVPGNKWFRISGEEARVAVSRNLGKLVSLN